MNKGDGVTTYSSWDWDKAPRKYAYISTSTSSDRYAQPKISVSYSNSDFSELESRVFVEIDKMIDINYALTFDFLARKQAVDQEDLEDIAYRATQFGQEFALKHYDRYDIQGSRQWIYQRISEEIAEWVNKTVHEEFNFDEDGWEVMYDAMISAVMHRINYEEIDETLDEILHNPITMSEKLKDIGMSESDFL